jgi:hypothetical protein
VADLKWRGCGDGSYVSHDGRFLVAQVTTPGKKGPRQQWALYGRVIFKLEVSAHPTHPWGWTEAPLIVGATKGKCQTFAAACGYEVPTIDLTVIRSEGADAVGQTRGWEHCLECGVRYERDENHKYGDYCGKGCTTDAAERLMEILGNGGKVEDIDGRPLRVGPARPNEPDFVRR